MCVCVCVKCKAEARVVVKKPGKCSEVIKFALQNKIFVGLCVCSFAFWRQIALAAEATQQQLVDA